MTKPTYGFNKLVGVKIATVEIAASGCRAVLIDENGVTYTLTSPGEMSVTKSTPRKPSTPKIKRDQEVIIEEIDHHPEYQVVRQRVMNVIQEHMLIDSARYNSGLRLIADLDADSLDLVEIIMAIEDEFNIEIEDDVVERLTDPTIADIARVVARIVYKK